MMRNNDSTASGGKAVMFAAPSTTGNKTAVVMIIGDSISSGEDEASSPLVNGFRYYLIQNLPGYTIKYVGSITQGNSLLAGNANYQAVSGACIKYTPCPTEVWLPQTPGLLKTYKPDIVIMQGGGNDFCCGASDSYVTAAMHEWIQSVFTNAPNASILAWMGERYHPVYDNELQSYVAQQAAAGKKIYYADGRDVPTKDGTHPNDTGYKQLAAKFAPIIKQIIDSR